MTAWTPTITLTVNGAAYSGYVDWRIQISSQQNQLWALPYPSTARIALHFLDANGIAPLSMGDIVQIKINYSTGSAAFYTGKVTSTTLRYNTYGAAGFDLINEIELSGALAVLANATGSASWGVTLDGGLPGNTYHQSGQIIQLLMADIATVAWAEVNPTTTWNDLDTTWTWNNFDASQNNLINGYQVNANSEFAWIQSYATTITNVNLLDWLQRLNRQANGITYEDATGKIIFDQNSPTPTPIDIPAGVLDPYSLATSSGINGLRNSITITQGANTYYQTSDMASVELYGTQTASLEIYEGNTPTTHAGDLADRMLDGLAFPKNGITGFALNLLNPDLTDAQRDALLATRTMSAFNITGVPAYFGYSGKCLVTAYTWSIDRNQFVIQADTVPFTNFYPGDTWNQISPAYTWTSYGAAFPTQKWSDL